MAGLGSFLGSSGGQGLIATGASGLFGFIGQGMANRQARRNMEYQNTLNRSYIEDERRYEENYNSPAAQMQRFKDAGLNPHLIYGQGNPGNVSMPAQQSAERQFVDPRGMLASLVPGFEQSMMLKSQRNAIDQKITESGARVELMDAQKKLVEANPLLQGGLEPIMDRIRAEASTAESNAYLAKFHKEYDVIAGQKNIAKINQEIDNLERQYKLQEKDDQIKAEIIKSKQFQNQMDEMIRNFKVDGTMSPQQWFDLGFGLLRLIKPR